MKRFLSANGSLYAEFFAADPGLRAGVTDGTLPGLWETGGLFAPQSLVVASGITAARPEGAADAYAVVHDRTLTAGSLLANDPDGCGCEEEERTAELVPDTGPSHGTFVDADGKAVDGPNPDGTFRYRPDPGFVGEDGFEYRIVCGEHVSDPIPVVVSVTNTAPAATGGGTYFPGGIGSSGAVPAIDADADPLTFTRLDGPYAGGIVWDKTSGGFEYTADDPPADFDFIENRAGDGLADSGPGLHLISQWGGLPFDRPFGFGASAWVTHDRTLTAVAGASTPLSGGEEPATAAWAAVTGPDHGSVAFVDGIGTFVYTPDPGYVGTDRFGYVVTQAGKASDPAPVLLTVVNRPPVARADAFQTVQGDALTGSVRTNDTDADLDGTADADALRLAYTRVADVEHGELTLAGNGTFTYTPDPDWYGHDRFTYTVSDGVSETDEVTVWLSTTPRQVGDRVWLDADGDGLQGYEGDEPGIPDVSVELLDAAGSMLASTTTDAEGHYGFRGLEKDAEYRVRVEPISQAG